MSTTNTSEQELFDLLGCAAPQYQAQPLDACRTDAGRAFYKKCASLMSDPRCPDSDLLMLEVAQHVLQNKISKLGNSNTDAASTALRQQHALVRRWFMEEERDRSVVSDFYGALAESEAFRQGSEFILTAATTAMHPANLLGDEWAALSAAERLAFFLEAQDAKDDINNKTKLPLIRLLENVSYSTPHGGPCGEIDGLLVAELQESQTLVVLACCEVKAKPVDLIKAREQRVRLLTALEQFPDHIQFFKTKPQPNQQQQLKRAPVDPQEQRLLQRLSRSATTNFTLFLQEPSRRWLLLSVGTQRHLTVPVFSPQMHILRRCLASVAARAPALPQLPVVFSPPQQTTPSVTTSTTTLSLSLTTRRQREDDDDDDDNEQQQSDAQQVANNNTKPPSEMVRCLGAWRASLHDFFSRRWAPTAQDAAFITKQLSSDWQRKVKKHPCLGAGPRAVMDEHLAVQRRFGGGGGNLMLIKIDEVFGE